MNLVPLVSNADNKIILLMSNVNNNRSGPVFVPGTPRPVCDLRICRCRSIRLPLTVMTNETAGQRLKGHQGLACDKRRVSPETCVMVIDRTSRDSNESIGLLQKG